VCIRLTETDETQSRDQRDAKPYLKQVVRSHAKYRDTRIGVKTVFWNTCEIAASPPSTDYIYYCIRVCTAYYRFPRGQPHDFLTNVEFYLRLTSVTVWTRASTKCVWNVFDVITYVIFPRLCVQTAGWYS